MQEPPESTLDELILIAQHGIPRQPSRLLFSWRVQEPDFRGSGSGVARLEPPHRARLDLFLDNGETAGIAALVENELRIPSSVPPDLIPVPPLLWAVFGVFRPGSAAEYLDGSISEGTLEASYRLPSGERVRFSVSGGAVREAVVVRRGSVVERVELSKERDGSYPKEVTYRNLPEFRELKLELESFEYVDPFPPDIWNPSDADA